MGQRKKKQKPAFPRLVRSSHDALKHSPGSTGKPALQGPGPCCYKPFRCRGRGPTSARETDREIECVCERKRAKEEKRVREVCSLYFDSVFFFLVFCTKKEYDQANCVL